VRTLVLFLGILLIAAPVIAQCVGGSCSPYGGSYSPYGSYYGGTTYPGYNPTTTYVPKYGAEMPLPSTSAGSAELV
jgi:hypothetical protein